MKFKCLSLCLLVLLGSNSSLANTLTYKQLQPVLKKNICLSCHRVDVKIIGPSYMEIAEKYQNNAENREQLTKSIKMGSAGKWGRVPMPSNLRITDEDTALIVDWIMSGAQK